MHVVNPSDTSNRVDAGSAPRNALRGTDVGQPRKVAKPRIDATAII
jgi:hypothetical protein